MATCQICGQENDSASAIGTDWPHYKCVVEAHQETVKQAVDAIEILDDLIHDLKSDGGEITRYATVKDLECVRKILNGGGDEKAKGK